MRALAIASALFSVLLFTLNGALARASDPQHVARYAVISLGCTKGAHGVAGCRQSPLQKATP
jgi:hypothetical protein